jgi:hypothetical protein
MIMGYHQIELKEEDKEKYCLQHKELALVLGKTTIWFKNSTIDVSPYG